MEGNKTNKQNKNEISASNDIREKPNIAVENVANNQINDNLISKEK